MNFFQVMTNVACGISEGSFH